LVLFLKTKIIFILHLLVFNHLLLYLVKMKIPHQLLNQYFALHFVLGLVMMQIHPQLFRQEQIHHILKCLKTQE